MKLTKKMNVKVNQMKLEGLLRKENDGEGISIEMKWKGPHQQGLLAVPFYGRSNLQKNRTAAHRVLSRKQRRIEFDDEFECICDLSFSSWISTFYILSEDRAKSNGKTAVLGKVSLDLAEFSAKMETEIYRKLPVTIKNGREVYEASLAVCLNYAEVRNVSDPIGIVLSSDQSQGGGLLRKVMGFTRKKSEIRNCPGESVYPNSDDSTEFDSDVKARSGPYQALEPDPVQKNGFFLWKKKRRLSLKPSWETSIDMTGEVNDAVGIQDVDRSVTTFQAEPDEILLDTNSVTTIKEEERWKEKEIVSRDGKSRLKSQVFFASIDQRSKKAAGESACTALVAVMAHWLLSSPAHLFQPRPDFDDLIITGSLEWQKLCNNETYITTFPDRHFDLETVIKAKIRPLTVQAEKSFVGFFCPEKFDCLKEAMSFDQIWEEIESKEEDSVYIVSWNDHFFVLKMEEDACYVIDSLGERLFEGCNQAYILKFDGSSSMMLHENVENEGEDDVICRGKECCREFIKRFLAGVTVRELEEEQDRNDFSPHQRLQIELHYTNLVTSSC